MAVMTQTTGSPHARLRGAGPADVRWLPGFRGDRFEQCRRVTLPHLWRLADDPGAGHALTNLRLAAGDAQGEFRGTHWQDEWVYKWIEAASYVFAVTRDAWLDARMDEAIDLIARAQAPDGYIATQTQVRGSARYAEHMHHEVYVMGHLLSAACAHHRATGKGTFLEPARKVADYLHATFSTPHRRSWSTRSSTPPRSWASWSCTAAPADGATWTPANVSIDYHGATPGGSDQMQDRVPLREENQVVGHMVLSTYLYAGATDAYLETGDETLKAALDRLWDHLTQRRTYLHGGVAPVHRGFSVRPRQVVQTRSAVRDAPPVPPTTPGGFQTGPINTHLDVVHEAAGDDYKLPNSTAYNETCAQIGTVLWNWRLLAATASARYAEAIEHTLFNSVLSGIGLEGASWFYTNPLRFYGESTGCSATMRTNASSPATVTSAAPATWPVPSPARTASPTRCRPRACGSICTAPAARRHAPRRGPFRAPPGDGLPVGGSGAPHRRSAPEAEVALALRIPSWAEGATLRVVEQTGEQPGVDARPAEARAIERAATRCARRRWSAARRWCLTCPCACA